VIPSYKVTALPLGKMLVDRSKMIYQTGAGEPLEIPAWGAAIEGDGARILVDTGIGDASWVSEHLVPAWIEPRGSMLEALAELGWSVNDVDVVVNTHLHHDHCGNNRLFPNARFVVSAEEWAYAHAPDAVQRSLYNNELIVGSISFMDYELVSADYFAVRQGIVVVRTPGHTPGHASVLVRTDEGDLCVTGDAAPVRDCFRLGKPGGIFTSVGDAEASLKKIRQLADRVLLGHDPLIVEFQSSGYPTVDEVSRGAGGTVVEHETELEWRQ